MSYLVCLLPGDGIGPEVTSAAREVIEASGVDIEWVILPVGETAEEFCGSALPGRTIAAISGHGLALKGPVTTPAVRGHTSINIQLRKRLNLFAAVRPIHSLSGLEGKYGKVDLVVIRENTQGLYSAAENEILHGVVQSLKVMTGEACTKIARFAFDYAQKYGRSKITVLHKANVMKKSEGLFLRCARRVRDAHKHKLEYEELTIDNVCMRLFKEPSRFDVLLMSNIYGDIVSKLASTLVGGIGLVPGASIGENCVIFETAHGSAMDIARKGVANPLASIMSGEMMLRHLGEHEAADKIHKAYTAVVAEGKPEHLTVDIGGKATTRDCTQAIIRAMG